MKVILYMAASVNGKITGKNDDTSWVDVDDIERMDALMIECGVMLMGSETYRSFGDDLPANKAKQIVMTNNGELLSKKQANVVFTNQPLQKVLSDLEGKGHTHVLLAGGSELNTSMIKENLIDEIRLILKPMIIGDGKDVFNTFEGIENYKSNSVEQLSNGSIEITLVK